MLRKEPLWWRPLLAACAVLAAAGPAGAHQAIDPAIVARIPPRSESLSAGAPDVIERGRRLFSEETFGGNGRTCASCHPPSNDFTLDPAFIATLPPRDPLFVAEFDPKLRALENPDMMRRFALILENLDGFDRPGVLRSVPHTLALALSIQPDQGPFAPPGRPVFPLAAALGWSGDGSPGDGSLRNFAVGAVVQHFPRRLDRVPGKDFRLPTADELDALEAFQLSLGRREALVVDPAKPDALTFASAAVSTGQTLFHNAPSRGGTRNCSGCHSGAGATDAAGNNRNRANGTERSANAPACRSAAVIAGDGGFGNGSGVQEDGVDQGSVVSVDRATFCGAGVPGGPVTFIGTTFFNTPPLVEAADTPPFFHNNSADTIEEAVAFYTSDTFNGSISGNGNAFVLSALQINQIGAFLRAINAIENNRSATAFVDAASGRPVSQVRRTIELAIADIGDAIEVLTGGPLPLFQGLGVVEAFAEARSKLRDALARLDPTQVAAARVDLQRARGLMLAPSS